MRFPLYHPAIDGPALAGRPDAGASRAPRETTVRDTMVSVMLKPSAELARSLAHLEDGARARPPELLHTVIQPVGDRSWLTDADIEAAGRALSRLRYSPFLMLFDRIEDRRVEGGAGMALSGGTRNCAAQDFRLAVLDALFGHFRQLPSYRLHPHMTLDDRGGRPGHLLDRPVAWLVEEFALVESVHGETRHVEHGRWRLRGD